MSRQFTADTLSRVSHSPTAADRADSLLHTQYDSLATADTLQAIDRLSPIRSPYRQVESESFFGIGTTLAPQLQQDHQIPTSTGMIFLQGSILLLLLFCIRFLIQNAPEIHFLFSQPFRDAVTGKQRLYDEQGNLGYLRFLSTAGVIGLVFLGCAFGAYISPQVLPPLSEVGQPLLLALGGILALVGLLLFQHTVLGLAGIITLTQPFIRQLLLLKRTYFALIFFALIPLLLFTIFTPENSRSVWEWLIIAELSIFMILFLKESLILFLSQKLSILHWFLYLCIVECLPVSFIVLIVTGK